MTDPTADTVPYATHRGVLSFAGFDFAVFQLSTGERVISEETVVRWLSMREAGGEA